MFRKTALLIFLVMLVATIGASSVATAQMEDNYVWTDFDCGVRDPGGLWTSADEQLRYARDLVKLHRMSWEFENLEGWGILSVNTNTNVGLSQMSVWGSSVNTIDGKNGGFVWQWLTLYEGGVPVWGHTVGEGFGDFEGYQASGDYVETITDVENPCGGPNSANIWSTTVSSP